MFDYHSLPRNEQLEIAKDYAAVYEIILEHLRKKGKLQYTSNTEPCNRRNEINEYSTWISTSIDTSSR